MATSSISLLAWPDVFREDQSAGCLPPWPALGLVDRMIPRPHLGRAAGIVLPLFSLRSAGDWGIRRHRRSRAVQVVAAPRPGFARCGCCRSARCRRDESSPYSALSAMAMSIPSTSRCQTCTTSACWAASRSYRWPIRAALRTAVRHSSHAPPCRRKMRAPAVLPISSTTPTGCAAGPGGIVRGVASWEDVVTRRLRFAARYTAACRGPASRCRSDPTSRARARMRVALRAKSSITSTPVIADERWADAREGARRDQAVRRCALHGRHRQRRRLGEPARSASMRTTGTPPDAFSATGQDWGLPVHAGKRWRATITAGCDSARDEWPAADQVSPRPSRRLLPHARGRWEKSSAASSLLTKPIRSGRANRSFQLFQATGPALTAGDPGPHPGLRPRLAQANPACPDTRSSRWERGMVLAEHPFVPPSEYRAVSVATTSTRHRADGAVVGDGERSREARDVGSLGGGWTSLDADPAALPFTVDVHAAPAALRRHGRGRPCCSCRCRGCLWLARSHQRPRSGRAPTTGRGACLSRWKRWRPTGRWPRPPRHPAARAVAGERPSCLSPSAHRSPGGAVAWLKRARRFR